MKTRAESILVRALGVPSWTGNFEDVSKTKVIFGRSDLTILIRRRNEKGEIRVWEGKGQILCRRI